MLAVLSCGRFKFFHPCIVIVIIIANININVSFYFLGIYQVQAFFFYGIEVNLLLPP